MEIYLIVCIMLIHLFNDSIFQTNEEQVLKTFNTKILLNHCIKYTLVWILPIVFFYFSQNLSIINIVFKTYLFCLITFITHFIIDYITTLLIKRLTQSNDYNKLFFIKNFDQFLHIIIAILLVKHL